MGWLEEASNIYGWMSLEELRWLHEQASVHEVVLEVGVWMGRSTYAICSGCSGKVLAVDPFDGGTCSANPKVGAAAHQKYNVRENAYQYLKTFLDSGKLEIREQTSMQALADLDGEPFLDMLFIDGDHSYEAVTNDLQMARLVKPGGLVCGHDYDEYGVSRAIAHLKFENPEGTRIWAVTV